MRRVGSEPSPSPLDTVEEAFQLLRQAPPGALAVYYAGTLPFAFAALYVLFQAQAGRLQTRDLGEASLALAVLFSLMKCAHALFARRLRAALAAAELPRLKLGQLVRMFSLQTLVQPTGLFLVPLALLAAVPFVWVYAFYQSFTVLADGEKEGLRDAYRDAFGHASLWPRENHLVVAILALFAFCVALNWLFAFLVIPQLLHGVFGIETVFVKATAALLDLSLLATAAALTYLCVDPLAKAVYVVRCFYGQSLRSGEDLKAQLRELSGGAAAGLSRAGPAIFVACATLLLGASGRGEVLAASRGVSARELDRAISEVSAQEKYRWPGREEEPAEGEESGLLARFSASVRKIASDAAEKAGKLLRKLWDWIFPRRKGESVAAPASSSPSPAGLLLAMAIALAAVALIALIRFLIQRRGAGQETLKLQAALPAVDLSDENLGAEDLPEDEWTRLGQDLLRRGEWRLALRAFYLSSLAHLARRELIAPARYKSNREYQRELERRARARPNLIELFRAIVGAFERIWYGMHEIDEKLVRAFTSAVQKLKALE